MPKPVTDTVDELLNEQANAEIKNPNYLLNPRYDSEMLADSDRYGHRYTNRMEREQSRNYTQLMTRTGSSEETGMANKLVKQRQRSSVFRPSPYYEPIPGMKNSVTNLKNPLYIDKQGTKLLYKPTGKSVKNSQVKL